MRLAIFRDAIEGHFKVSVTRDNLAHAIALYNKTRSLLRQLSGMLKKDIPPITGREYLSIVLAGFSIPKEPYNQLLEELIKEIKGRKPDVRYKTRLLLMGSAFDDLNVRSNNRRKRRPHRCGHTKLWEPSLPWHINRDMVIQWENSRNFI